jgi:RNA12 protein
LERFEVERERMLAEVGSHMPPPAQAIYIGGVYPSIFGAGRLVEWIRLPFRVLTGGRWVPLRRQQERREGELLTLLSEHALKPLKLVPRVRDGGCFVYFESEEDAAKGARVLRFYGQSSTSKKGKTQASFLAGKSVNARFVRGDPWMEDLLTVMPTPSLRIGALPGRKMSLSEEEVYELLRPYGRLHKVEATGSAGEALFIRKEDAVAARNCLHGMIDANSERLVISFLPYSLWAHFKKVRDAITSPRMLPLLVLLIVAGMSLLVEPFRQVNVIQTIAVRGRAKNDPALDDVLPRWAERDTEAALERHFRAQPTGISLVTGPPGCGKSSSLSRVLAKRSYTLHIDCSPSALRSRSALGGSSSSSSPSGARSNVPADASAFVAQLERSVGFRPSFRFINKVLSFLESFLPKGNDLSMSTNDATDQVLGALGRALHFIAVATGATQEPAYPVVVFSGFHELIDELKSTSNDAAAGQRLAETMLHWATTVAHEYRSAHIVFVTDAKRRDDIVIGHLPARAGIALFDFDDLTIGDAVRYVETNLLHQSNSAQLDLDALARRASQSRGRARERPVKPSAAATAASSSSSEAATKHADNSESAADESDNGSQTSWFGTLVQVVRGGVPTWSTAAAPSSNGADKTQQHAAPLVGSAELASDGSHVLRLDGISADLHEQIVGAVSVIGGRLRDLKAFTTRLTLTSASVSMASGDMVEATVLSVLRDGFASTPHTPDGKRWSHSMLWKCIALLAKDGSVSEAVLINSVFDGNPHELDALVEAGQLARRIDDDNSIGVVASGRVSIVPPSPLHLAAFKALSEPPHYYVLERMRLSEAIAKSTKYIVTTEEELAKLLQGDSPRSQSTALLPSQETRRAMLSANLEKYCNQLAAQEAALNQLKVDAQKQ